MPDDGPSKRSRAETIFLGAVFGCTLLISIAFVIATIGWGLGFPAVVVALLLGMSIATLAYAFLGGVGGTEFTVGAAKLAGSAALIAIVYWLVSGPLEKNMNDVKAIAAGKVAEGTIAAERQNTLTEHNARLAAEQKVRELQSQAGIAQSDSDAAVLARIRQSSPDDDLGRGIIGIYRSHQGPFRSRTMQLKARFIQDVADGTFRYCHDGRPELADKKVQLEVVDPETGTSRKIALSAGGDIGPGACQVIKFDIQVGCDAAGALLQVDCDAHRGVAWPAPSDNRIYELVATVLNPDFD